MKKLKLFSVATVSICVLVCSVSVAVAAVLSEQEAQKLALSLTPQTIQNAIDGGNTPSELLSYAASWGQKPEVITALLMAGADVNFLDRHGLTPLILAVTLNKNLEVIGSLIDSGSNVNARCVLEGVEMTTLMAALLRHDPNPETIQLLIDGGAEVNAVNKKGFSVLLFAVTMDSSPEVINILINAGARVNDVFGKNGITALMLAAKNSEDPGILNALLDAGADIKMKNKKGKTALDFARENESLKNSDVLKRLEGRI